MSNTVMSHVVIGIASNCEREKNITAALDALHITFGHLLISPVYESQAYSQTTYDQNNSKNDRTEKSSPYYNLVVSLQTSKPMSELKQWLKNIEDQQKRQRATANVTLDMDLLLYDDYVGGIDHWANASLPHIDIETHAYVLRPLSDILPDLVHPVLGKRYAALWESFTPNTCLTPVDFVWHSMLLSTSAPPPAI